MSGDNERYNDAADSACMEKERRRHQNAEAKQEALEDNFKKTFSGMMKHNAVKKALALEAREATRRGDRRFSGRSLEEIMEIAGRPGTVGAYEGDTVTPEEANYRPWEE